MMKKAAAGGFCFSGTGAFAAACLMIAGTEAFCAVPDAAGNPGGMTMENDQMTVRCQTCGAVQTAGSEYCSECGAVLDRHPGSVMPEIGSGFPGSVAGPSCFPNGVIGIAGGTDGFPEADFPPGPDDRGLKLLVDCCRKTIATGAGDSHEETVLYLDERTGEYQIHTYVSIPGSSKERHRGFKTDKKALDAVMSYISEKDLERFSGHEGFPMAGGEYVCKYLSAEGRVIRLSTSNVPHGMHGDLYGTGILLNSFIDEKMEILPERNEAETRENEGE